MKLSKPGDSGYIKGVLFGPPKTGKTTLATTLPGKTLLILTEPEGDLSIVGRENVDVLRVSKYSDLAEAITHLQGPNDYETVVFDSVTFAAEIIGGDQLADALLQKKEPRQVYNKINAVVNRAVRKLIDLDMNVIFITQMKDVPEEDVDEEEGKYPLSMAVTPGVYKIVAAAVSFLGRTYKKRGLSGMPPKPVVEYWVSFEDYGRSPAGSRADLPNAVQSPTLTELFAASKGESQ